MRWFCDRIAESRVDPDRGNPLRATNSIYVNPELDATYSLDTQHLSTTFSPP
jgi:hypothetical protein